MADNRVELDLYVSDTLIDTGISSIDALNKPVKGVDYWTDSERAEVVDEASSAALAAVRDAADDATKAAQEATSATKAANDAAGAATTAAGDADKAAELATNAANDASVAAAEARSAVSNTGQIYYSLDDEADGRKRLTIHIKED